MAQDGVFVYPDAGKGGSSSTDLLAAAALMGNGGFGSMNNPFWMMFMWPLMYPFINMFGGGFGGWNNGAGPGGIANMLNNDAGRELIVQAINGRADALGQIAQMTHTNVDFVRQGISAANTKLAEVAGAIGITSAQLLNGIQAGDATLGRQLCECCCENRLAIANQTNTLQSQAAANFAAQQLQLAQNHADDRLDVCQQTNTLRTDGLLNTQAIKDAIAGQSAMIIEKFCDLEKRELQDKINAQGDMITQLRGQLDNDRQTSQLFAAINPIQIKLNELAAKQPNTVPVQWPNLIAVNATPYGYGYGQTNFWN